MSQWGSQDLARRGYSPVDILRYYYPSDVRIVESTNFVSEIEGIYPGVMLREGSSGSDVLLMQRYLNYISGNFLIPPIPNVNGNFSVHMKYTTIEFQRIANLPDNGIIDKSTWYEIIRYYTALRQN